MVASPASVEIQGPSSHVTPIREIPTATISVAGRISNFSETVDLDIRDSLVRILKSTSVKVDVQLKRSER